jgi:GTP-binding protein
MLPVVALVGRPNVGKSTLFNYLTRSRDALVADFPGLTRDRQYGYGKVGPMPYIVVDTGGLSGEADGVEGLAARQTLQALDEADRVLFLVDGREGLTAADEDIADLLRRRGRPVRVVVNKAEGMPEENVAAEFHALGLGNPVAISAAHGQRVRALLEATLAGFEAPGEEEADRDAGLPGIRVAVVGRPNVGKSTLINRLVGEERVVAYDLPGTTRDSVEVPFSRDGQDYVLIDTAGVRRRRSVSEAIEKFSIIKALKAVDEAHVVIAVLDARDGVTEQDVSLIGLTAERGRGLVIAVNKWDGLPAGQRERIQTELDRRLPFIDYAKRHFISALHGSGVGRLAGSVRQAWAAGQRDLPTPDLNRVLEAAVTEHQPPLVRGRRIKLRYAHQGGRNPPVIVVHGNQTDRLPAAYRRYLANTFRRAFDLHGTPVRVELKSGRNPYEGRRNTLTPRQERKRKRMMKHLKGKGR